ncbi:UDP-glucose dehydrogenase family protein [Bosea massiliensis]|uniref:UDP-glucose 6-dehydrogenase n=1 Tax=Bosea massiliensis TaxID=151419 RepID=A0ABW0P757_9HYPH
MSVAITMIGTGYVGLVTGACFAEMGHDVICVDRDEAKVELLRRNVMPIYEPGLAELVSANVAAGQLRFSTDVSASVKGRDAVFLAVGTPSETGSGRADLRFVFKAAFDVAMEVDKPTVIVTKSTVPVGTNRKLANLMATDLQPRHRVSVASNPEFMREGAAISDFMEPDRIVFGSDDASAIEVLERIYKPLTDKGAKALVTGLETAELIKYAANAFLAVKVTFINEIADLCEKVGADVEVLATGVGLDARIGKAFLKAGPGWGGSCFPKDTKALIATAQDFGSQVRTVESAVSANDARKRAMAGRIASLCGGNLAGKKLAIFGLTFKGGTDDMRESPSLDIVPLLQALGARVHGHDPSNPRSLSTDLPDLIHHVDPLEAVDGAEALVILTDWPEFRSYEMSAVAKRMAQPILIDTRNMYDGAAVLAAGFKRYYPIGRAPVIAPADD